MPIKGTPVKLLELLESSGLSYSIQENPTLHGLSYDTRRLEKGDLFFAIQGANFDGHEYIEEAAKKGAAAVVAEREIKTSLPLIKTDQIMVLMSKLAHHFYGRPSLKIPVVGITGTNGKTTSTYILETILKSAGQSCGVLGTVNYRFKDQTYPAPNTTPFSIDVHKFLHSLVVEKATALIMEVSSHALALHRVDDVRFSLAVFTNLTQDHLDFHKDMESYFAAKSKLFERGENLKAVINRDDAYGRRLMEKVKSPLTFGTDPSAQLQAQDMGCDLSGLRFKLKFPSGHTEDIQSNLVGRHNLSNLLASAGAALTLGLTENEVVKGLHQPHHIPGRLERIEGRQKFLVVVDYAHTPDALKKALTALKELGPKKLICVFGAGGDRDRTKRPKMGKIAVQTADQVILTSDNPRTEDPHLILSDIEKGIASLGKNNFSTVENREKAIQKAIEIAKEGDIILIAGKGHEDYQIYGKKKIHFSDQESARKALGSWN